MTLSAALFYILAALTTVSAAAVVVTENIVRAAVWLLFTLIGVAGVFFLLDAEFVGATQLLVYVGGTLVLVVFGVMLTAQGPLVNLGVSAAEWAIAAAVGLSLYGVLAYSLAGLPRPAESAVVSQPTPSYVIGLSLLGETRATGAAEVSGPPAGVVGQRRPIAYLLPFEIVSVHLLVVLIGAAYLARAKRRRSAGATS
jgi:NADH-quinone oxidoreductase subunit J